MPAKKPPPAPAPRNGLPTKRAILDYLTEVNGDATRRDIARAFNLKGEQRTQLRSLLKEMSAEHLLASPGGKRIQTPNGKAAGSTSALPPVLPLDVNAVDDDGGLICIPSKWRADDAPPFIILPARDAAKQKPSLGIGDRILARIKPIGKNKFQANVIKAIGRGEQRVLAVFRARKFGGVGDPIDRKVRQKFTIDRDDSRGAADGDLVWVEAARRRGAVSTKARVLEIAGHVDDKNAFSLMALANHGIPTDMPAAALKEAQNVKEPSLDGREDLRNIPLLTIDPEDAKDHDDAVWAAPDDDPDNPGGYEVIIAIADVSWFVREGSALDREARRRGNSVYLPDRVVPMLPEHLSNGLCSLKVNEERPCLAVRLILDKDGQKRKHTFLRGAMRSAAKLSYEDAQAIITTPQSGAIGDTVRYLKAAYDTRMIERAKRAPLDLDLPERRVVLNDDGNVVRVERRARFDAHRLIEEFMILANIAAAETLERARMSQIYRIHGAPDEEKLTASRDYLDSLGYSLVKGGSVRPRHFNQLLAIAADRDQKELVSEVVLRSQTQAFYGLDNEGHFGLNLARYSHFTSPIRRYADLTIHRALVAAGKLGDGGQAPIDDEDLAEIAQNISDTERRAMAAEREAKDRYLASFLEDRVGDEFDGRIRGVTRFGLFVALDETGADGFIPMRSVGFERFRHDEGSQSLIGETTGGVYRLGQIVRIRLAEAAPLTGGLRFDLLSDPIPNPKAAKTQAAKTKATKAKGEKPRVRNSKSQKSKPTASSDAKTRDRGKPRTRGQKAASELANAGKETPTANAMKKKSAKKTVTTDTENKRRVDKKSSDRSETTNQKTKRKKSNAKSRQR